MHQSFPHYYKTENGIPRFSRKASVWCVWLYVIIMKNQTTSAETQLSDFPDSSQKNNFDNDLAIPRRVFDLQINLVGTQYLDDLGRKEGRPLWWVKENTDSNTEKGN